MSRDEHHVGLGLAHARRDGPHSDFGHQLHVHACQWVRVLQVVDQLLQILDGIDVVVRRRTDESHAGRAVTRLGHPRIHLVTGQLTAFSRLGSLRHLDLQIVGVHQVLTGHAESTRGHLLDGRATRGVVQALGILAALTGVALSADRVHGDRERLVRFGRDRSVAHGPGGEALHDVGDALDLLDRNRTASGGIELEETAQRGQMLRLIVDETGVLLEDVVSLRAGRVLQLEDGFRVEQVVFAFASPLVLATEFQLAMRATLRVARIRDRVSRRHFGGDLVQTNTAQTTDRAGEVFVHQVRRQTDGLENLGSGVRSDRAHAHLRHHLQHALTGRLDVLLQRRARVDVTQVVQILADHVLDGLESQVRVDGPGSESDEQSHVMDLAGVARLHDQADLGALLLADEVMVNRRGEQERRNGRQHFVAVSIGENDDTCSGIDRRGHVGTNGIQSLFQRLPSTGDPIQTGHHVGVQFGM